MNIDAKTPDICLLLTQKTHVIRKCYLCGISLLVIVSNDGTYFGAHHFGPLNIEKQKDGMWICKKCL